MLARLQHPRASVYKAFFSHLEHPPRLEHWTSPLLCALHPLGVIRKAVRGCLHVFFIRSSEIVGNKLLPSGVARLLVQLVMAIAGGQWLVYSILYSVETLVGLLSGMHMYIRKKRGPARLICLLTLSLGLRTMWCFNHSGSQDESVTYVEIMTHSTRPRV